MFYSTPESVQVICNFPSFPRLLKILKSVGNISILRFLEYEFLATHPLSGRILDVGGGSKTNYSHLLDGWTETDKSIYESINIDTKTQPTYLFKPDDNFPINDEQYDTVMSLNTFEHVYDINRTMVEINRVLKLNGKLVFSVPFMFRVHGHPDDYFRGTASFWTKTLSVAGFRNIEIFVLNWGPFSTGEFISGSPGPFQNIRKAFSLVLDTLYFRVRRQKSNDAVLKQDHDLCHSPLGYFICAQK